MNIEHNKETKRFYLELKGGVDAELKYRLIGGSSVDFYSTFVPNTHRGRGLASKLVQAAITWAEKNNLNMHASCWYARNFIN